MKLIRLLVSTSNGPFVFFSKEIRILGIKCDICFAKQGVHAFLATKSSGSNANNGRYFERMALFEI